MKRDLEVIQLIIDPSQPYHVVIKCVTDVVRAYKGVIKEKEALETSLQALSASRSTPSRDTSLNVSVKSVKSDSEVSGNETIEGNGV